MKKEKILQDMLYAGIGARKVTNNAYTQAMTSIGSRLADRGWTLRSGSAAGSDTAFENGCDLARGRKEIFVPWDGFSGRYPPNVKVPSLMDEAMAIAQEHHPAWASLSKGSKQLMARNVCIILGDNLRTPVKFVVVYTDRGKMVGGSAHAMSVAIANGIDILNIGDPFMRQPYAIQEKLVVLTKPYEDALARVNAQLSIEQLESERNAHIAAIDKAALMKAR